jgi:hypothetical protein
MDQLTFLSEEPLVSHSASQDSEADWMMTVATSRLSFLDLLKEHGPSGWFGRTSLASCHQTQDGTLVPFSEGWSNCGYRFAYRVLDAQYYLQALLIETLRSPAPTHCGDMFNLALYQT